VEYSHLQKIIVPVGPRLCCRLCKMDAGDDPDAVLALGRRALDLVSECAACSTIDVLRTISTKIADSAADMPDPRGAFDLSLTLVRSADRTLALTSPLGAEW
jgi:hypothetical protein